MDLDTALHTALVDDDIKKHCHVNSNEDGDRFVPCLELRYSFGSLAL